MFFMSTPIEEVIPDTTDDEKPIRERTTTHASNGVEYKVTVVRYESSVDVLVVAKDLVNKEREEIFMDGIIVND